MSGLNVGDSFPENVSFTYIPYTDDASTFKVCGIPIKYNASKEWADKKVVLVSIPGAFTPVCSANHLPGFVEALPALREKGVDVVAFEACNDAYVMSGWGKANGVKNDDVLFLADEGAAFAKSLGWNEGDRTGRWAIVVDHGKVTYVGKETKSSEFGVSSAESVLKAL
ncbi:peroxiredoxin pmp20 [Ascosphaera apis ARSEF 7405]|uniref:Thioredoxin peroxidase n=1 Tax=Ascosphaera apis ARSEF 7405 TaxID=392613 RepID=A0A168CAD9_9EURO|nr:peroxiredoxin pmp20 [Ascosphaera apis ARSEF 7405]